MDTESIINIFLEKQTVSNRKLIEELRRIIKGFSVELIETGNYKIPFYVFKHYILYISCDKKKGVYLGFTDGRLMKDEYGLFESPPDTESIRKVFIPKIDSELIEKLEFYLAEAMIVNEKLYKDKPYKVKRLNVGENIIELI